MAVSATLIIVLDSVQNDDRFLEKRIWLVKRDDGEN
jgi:hypothetical protein